MLKSSRNALRLFDSTPEQQYVTLIDAVALREAERLVESCEACNYEGAEHEATVVQKILKETPGECS